MVNGRRLAVSLALPKLELLIMGIQLDSSLVLWPRTVSFVERNWRGQLCHSFPQFCRRLRGHSLSSQSQRIKKATCNVAPSPSKQFFGPVYAKVDHRNLACPLPHRQAMKSKRWQGRSPCDALDRHKRKTLSLIALGFTTSLGLSGKGLWSRSGSLRHAVLGIPVRFELF